MNQYSVPWTLVGLTVTVRVNVASIKLYYGDRLVAGHERNYRKFVITTKDKHKTGLIERKPGGQKDAWQLAAVKNIGPKMQEYVQLIRSGNRSLRKELAKIMALSTVYGDQAVHLACTELLKDGIVGVDSLELLLKRLHHPANTELNPEPLNFQNQRLNRIVPGVDLRRYDALLFESKQNPSALEIEKYDGYGERESMDKPRSGESSTGDDNQKS